MPLELPQPLRWERIDQRTYRLTVDGKLRGSRARLLQELLEELARRGGDRILLDLRDCRSVDSLGAAALQTALDLGQRLYVVMAPGLDLEQPLGRAPLTRFDSIERAEAALAGNRFESIRLAPVRVG